VQLAQRDAGDIEAGRRIALYLDEIEAHHDYVLLLGDAGPTHWSRSCSRRSDELLLLADATRPPLLHGTERECLMQRGARSEATEQLVQSGALLKATLASSAIPGALAPVLHDGDLLCDGGNFNNFPVDVMRALPGIGRVIGSDLS
jgi:hypothetical protein